jgi:hypothetical protein
MKEGTLSHATNIKQQIDIVALAARLDALLSKEAESVPYKKGNIIFIKDYRIVKKDRHNFIVLHKQKRIAQTFHKKSAFAIVKHLLQNKEKKVKDVIDADRLLEKHYRDSIFYLNTITTTQSDIRQFVAETRFDLSKQKINHYMDTISDLAEW